MSPRTQCVESKYEAKNANSAILNVHSINSIDELCIKLQTSKEELYFLLRNIPKFYKQDPRDKKNGGVRILLKPIHRLKCFQRKILKNILESVPLNPCIHAYRKKHSHITNAQEHVGKKYLVNIDIKSFFPSIHFTWVQKLFIKIGCSPEISGVLTRLTTYNYCLPQGTPTSPYIANLILDEADHILRAACIRRNLVYTRYSDDITISGSKNFATCIGGFIEVIRQAGFRISREKMEKNGFLGPAHCKIVTGLVVNDKLNIPRDSVRRLQATIHNCIVFGPSSQNRESHPAFKEHLYGRVRYIRQINPQVGDKLLQMLEQVDWVV